MTTGSVVFFHLDDDSWCDSKDQPRDVVMDYENDRLVVGGIPHVVENKEPFVNHNAGSIDIGYCCKPEK